MRSLLQKPHWLIFEKLEPNRPRGTRSEMSEIVDPVGGKDTVLGSVKPLRICLTVNAAWNIWNFRRPLVSSLIADGHHLTILAPEDDYAAKLQAMGCRFVNLQMDRKGLNPANDALLVWRLRQAFIAERPDIILSFTIKNNLFGALAARSAKIPFVPNVTGLGTAFLSGGALEVLVRQLYGRAFKRLPVVFFQNQDDQELFVSQKLVGAEQARTLPGSGIDLAHFAALPFPDARTRPVFLMIARLLRDKGVQEFVEAARLVRRISPEARFQLLGAAGSDNRTAINLDTVMAWQQSHGIEYLGTSTDVREQIASAHCVVLPSYREGAPRTLIEAAASARPVIATDVAGCRAVVDDGKTGFLCEPRSAGSLASACLKFLEMGHAQQRLAGEKGRAKMEREFDEALVTRAYREVLAQLSMSGART